MIDFSRAFDVVDHSILLTKLTGLSRSDNITNWIILFLYERTQCAKVGNSLSGQKYIKQNIVQVSGVRPMLYAIAESDLHPLSKSKFLFNFADDTTLAV